MNFCKHKETEVCTIFLELSYIKILVISVHTSPSGNFRLFLNRLEVMILKSFKSSLKQMICCDITVNYHSSYQFSFSCLQSIASHCIQVPTIISLHTARNVKRDRLIKTANNSSRMVIVIQNHYQYSRGREVAQFVKGP